MGASSHPPGHTRELQVLARGEYFSRGYLSTVSSKLVGCCPDFHSVVLQISTIQNCQIQSLRKVAVLRNSTSMSYRIQANLVGMEIVAAKLQSKSEFI